MNDSHFNCTKGNFQNDSSINKNVEITSVCRRKNINKNKKSPVPKRVRLTSYNNGQFS